VTQKKTVLATHCGVATSARMEKKNFGGKKPDKEENLVLESLGKI